MYTRVHFQTVFGYIVTKLAGQHAHLLTLSKFTSCLSLFRCRSIQLRPAWDMRLRRRKPEGKPGKRRFPGSVEMSNVINKHTCIRIFTMVGQILNGIVFLRSFIRT